MKQDILKVELLKFVADPKKMYEAYQIDQVASQHCHTVLRLPPYHCELNSIEKAWGLIKSYVVSENCIFKIGEATKLTHEGIQKASSFWADCIKHIISEEEEMWKLDGLHKHIAEVGTVSFFVGNSYDDTELYTDDSLP